MNRNLALITLVVKDYDEAINFFCDKLEFLLIEDIQQSETKRWVVVAPQKNLSCQLLLAKAATPEQSKFIGNQTGGRVFLFLYTDDFERDLAKFKREGITIVRPPKQEPYGKVLVFADLYGNLWDLIESA